MSKTLYITQPGRIGDVIISLPIAKYYADRGYAIYWPVMEHVYTNMVGYVPYVTFVAVSDDILRCVTEARILIRKEQDRTRIKGETIELAFRFPFASEATNKFEAQNKPFDEFKYELAGVSFDEKWNLQITRNLDNEKYILSQLPSEFTLWHSEGSFNKWVHLEVIKGPVVKIEKKTNSVFDWIGALEKATELYLVDSCIANLVNQLNLTNRKYFQTKPEVKTMPILRGDWIKL